MSGCNRQKKRTWCIYMQTEGMQKARKNKGLERSFKMSISPEVYDTLEKEFDQLETE